MILIKQVSGLTDALTMRLVRKQNLKDLTDVVQARSNLGLGNSATRDVGSGAADVAAGDHTHKHLAIEQHLVIPDRYGHVHLPFRFYADFGLIDLEEADTSVLIRLQQNTTHTDGVAGWLRINGNGVFGVSFRPEFKITGSWLPADPYIPPAGQTMLFRFDYFNWGVVTQLLGAV
jgi:hypothetical protein